MERWIAVNMDFTYSGLEDIYRYCDWAYWWRELVIQGGRKQCDHRLWAYTGIKYM